MQTAPTQNKRYKVTVRKPKGRDGKNWQLRIFEPCGRERQKSSGTQDREEAEAMARAEQRRLNNEDLPLNKVAKAYLDFRAADPATAASSVIKYRQALRCISDVLGDQDVTKQNLVKVRDELLTRAKRPLKPKVINNYVGIAKHAWEWAIERGLVTEPWPQIKRLKETKTEKRPCTREQSCLMLQGYFEWEREFYPLACFMADTGARVGESMRIRGRDVDREALTVTLWITKTESRSVPVGADVLEIMSKVEPGELVFGDAQGRARKPAAMYRAWRRIAKRLELDREPISPHSLRRSWITTSLTTGVGIKLSMRITGHKTTRVHMDYARLAVDEGLHEAAEKVRAARPPLPHCTPTERGGGRVVSEDSSTEEPGGARGSRRTCSACLSRKAKRRTAVASISPPEHNEIRAELARLVSEGGQVGRALRVLALDPELQDYVLRFRPMSD